MITETGTVTRIDADYAWISTVKTSVCNACRAKSGCGQRLLSGAMGANMEIRARVSAETGAALAVGDRVEIGIEEGAVVGASLVAYGLPVLLMVTMATLLGGTSPLQGILAAGLGLALGAWLGRRWLAGHKNHNHFEPVILRRVDHLLAAA